MGVSPILHTHCVTLRTRMLGSFLSKHTWNGSVSLRTCNYQYISNQQEPQSHFKQLTTKSSELPPLPSTVWYESIMSSYVICDFFKKNVFIYCTYSIVYHFHSSSSAVAFSYMQNDAVRLQSTSSERVALSRH